MPKVAIPMSILKEPMKNILIQVIPCIVKIYQMLYTA